MLPPDRDLERRRPLWEALADLCLDSALDDVRYRAIATSVVASGYTPAEVQEILWREVLPVVETNLRSPAGEWAGFDADWLQERILAQRRRPHGWLERVRPASGVRRIVQQEWLHVLQFLPDEFRSERASG